MVNCWTWPFNMCTFIVNTSSQASKWCYWGSDLFANSTPSTGSYQFSWHSPHWRRALTQQNNVKVYMDHRAMVPTHPPVGFRDAAHSHTAMSFLDRALPAIPSLKPTNCAGLCIQHSTFACEMDKVDVILPPCCLHGVEDQKNPKWVPYLFGSEEGFVLKEAQLLLLQGSKQQGFTNRAVKSLIFLVEINESCLDRQCLQRGMLQRHVGIRHPGLKNQLQPLFWRADTHH